MTFLEYLSKNYSPTFVNEFFNISNESRTHCLILNKNKYTINDLFDIKIKEQHPFINYAYFFENNGLGNDFRFKNGVFYIQDSSAMMPVEFLDIKEGDIVLDMCAAPGGKTIDAAIKLNNTGLIVSNEVNYERAKILSSNIEKMGFCNVIVSNNDLSNELDSYYGCFDKIILDAPCSGSFMFRKNKLIEKDWSYEKVLRCAKVQKELLNNAANLVNLNGRIVYSTCSISKEENEDIIREFLLTHDNFKLIKINQNSMFYNSNLDGAIYLMPHIFNGEGQFIALLQKINNNVSINQKTIIKDQFRSTIKEKYKLNNFKNTVLKNELVFCFNTTINIKNLNVLKYGLHVSTLKKNVEIPSFHLAHYLSNNISISLTEDDFHKYIKGYELDLNIDDGFHIVSYRGINLGFVKSKNNHQKNYYPKGLRD